MYSARQRLRPWLEDKINSGKVPGLCWRDKEKKEFRVSWKHAGKPDFNYEKDAMLFKLWAEHTGKYHAGESPDPSTWKTRFRCALHKMPDVVEVRVPHSLDEKDPYRVFRFTDKVGMSKRNPVMKSKTVVLRPPPKSDEGDFNFRLYDSPHPDRSDGSFVDSYDLNDITPTIQTFHFGEIMMSDEAMTVSYGFPEQLSWLENHGESNNLMENGSVFEENTQVIQQNFWTTNPDRLLLFI